MDEIRNHIGADTLGYLSLPGLLSSVSGPEQNYCTACWSGKYRVPPTDEMKKDKLEIKS